MNDPLGVRGIQCVGNLDSQVQQCFQFYRTRAYAMLQSYSIQKLHGNERLAVLLADVVNRADVRMIQRRSGLRFALKAGEGLRVPGNIVGQELERDEAVQARVFRFVNHAHTAPANFFDNAIVGNGLADHEEWQFYSRSILWARQAVVNGGLGSGDVQLRGWFNDEMARPSRSKRCFASGLEERCEGRILMYRKNKNSFLKGIRTQPCTSMRLEAGNF